MPKFSFSVLALPLMMLLGACAAPAGEQAGEQPLEQDAVEVDSENVGTTSSALSTALSGVWKNTTPCNTTFYDPATGAWKCDGLTNLTGSMVGTSHYYLNGYVLSNGDVPAVLEETFDVTLANGATGTFRMKEVFYFEAATGKISITGFIAGGTGAFKKARGNLSFVGVSDPAGIGEGSFKGVIRY